MKTKTITLYELIELIRYGKAPKKIKYGDKLYYFDGRDYIPENGFYLSSVFNDYVFTDILKLMIEILPEENDEWEDIEEIDILQDILSTDKIGALIENIGEIQIIINKLIKNQKYLKEKLVEK